LGETGHPEKSTRRKRQRKTKKKVKQKVMKQTRGEWGGVGNIGVGDSPSKKRGFKKKKKT